MVTGTPRLLLRSEGALFLAAAVAAYHVLGGSWVLFAVLFFVPDLSLFGYVAGARAGAALYNAAHAYIGPVLLAVLAYTGALPGSWPIALVWAAHVAFDRALGYGLKYPTAFRDTHLGTVGRERDG